MSRVACKQRRKPNKFNRCTSLQAWPCMYEHMCATCRLYPGISCYSYIMHENLGMQVCHVLGMYVLQVSTCKQHGQVRSYSKIRSKVESRLGVARVSAVLGQGLEALETQYCPWLRPLPCMEYRQFSLSTTRFSRNPLLVFFYPPKVSFLPACRVTTLRNTRLGGLEDWRGGINLGTVRAGGIPVARSL